MNVRIVPAGNELIEEVAGLLSWDNRDCSKNLVVFPGRRPAHFLRKSLAEQAGGAFRPPKVLSMDGLVDFLYEQVFPGRKLETIDAVSMLYTIHKGSADPMGGKGFLNADAFFPLGLRIFSAIEELRIEDVRSVQVRDIEHFVQEAIPPNALGRLQTLSFFYDRFYEDVRGQGASTRASRYRAAATDIDLSLLEGYDTLIFAGFFSPSKCERDLFRKLDDTGKASFVFQEGRGLAERLAELGISIEDSERPSPPVQFYSSPDAHGQVFALNSMFSQLEDVNERTAVVLPSTESLFPLIRHGLTMFEEADFNVSMGYPIQRTPLFGFFMNLMELVTTFEDDRFYVPAYLKFVLHPYTKNIYLDGDAEITRILFHAIEDEFVLKRSKNFVSLRDIETGTIIRTVCGTGPAVEKALSEKKLRDHLRMIHERTIEAFLEFRNVEDFAEKCIGLVQFIDRHSTARLHPLFSPFAEAFVRALDLLGRSLMKDLSFQERESYFSFFRKYMTTQRVPFDGTPLKGLQVLGLLETRGLRFDRVFILDANEDSIPDTKKDDSMLPFRARQALGLPTYRDRDRLAAYYFDTLIQGAKEVHLLFVESDTKARSRFVEGLIWDRQRKDMTIDTARYVESVQYSVDLVNRVPEAIAKTDTVLSFLRSFRYSPTAVDRYLHCPLRFYYNDVLNAGRKRGIAEGIERADIGEVVHDILNRFFEDRRGRPLGAADLDASAMKDTVRNYFGERYGESSGALFLFRKQVERHLGDLLLNYYGPLFETEDITVLESEAKLEMEAEGFLLQGRLDAVEKRDGKTCIIDYKTGANHRNVAINFDRLDPADRETWPTAIGSLQLPFYLLLYMNKTGISLNDISASYLLLGKATINRDIEMPLFGGGDPIELFPLIREVMFSLLREINDPAVPFFPVKDRKSECPLCDFRYICGAQWMVRSSFS